MKAVCTEYGGKIVVRGNKKRPGVRYPRDKDHTLCQKRWKAEQDRSRVQSPTLPDHRET